MSLQVFQEFSFYLITSPLPQTNIHASTEKKLQNKFPQKSVIFSWHVSGQCCGIGEFYCHIVKDYNPSFSILKLNKENWVILPCKSCKKDKNVCLSHYTGHFKRIFCLSNELLAFSL